MNIFSYESKVSQVLMFVADLIILNVCFVICCLPIFTIGAAQAALYTAVRAINDPEDDRSPYKVFFGALFDGFGSVTLAWLTFFVVEVALFSAANFASGAVDVTGDSKHVATFWISAVALILVMFLHAQMPLFHSRFRCSAGQLIRNTFFLCLAHPLRSILVAVLIWAPLVLAFWQTGLFLSGSLAFILLYYSVVFLLNFIVMKKPFRTLIDHYNATHDEDGFAILIPDEEEPNETDEDEYDEEEITDEEEDA